VQAVDIQMRACNRLVYSLSRACGRVNHVCGCEGAPAQLWRRPQQCMPGAATQPAEVQHFGQNVHLTSLVRRAGDKDEGQAEL